MTNEQKIQISEILMARAEISGRTISKPAIRMMIEDLADLPFERVYATLQAWGRTSAEFPHPAKVREKLAPAETEIDDGRDIASKVIGAVARFGSYQGERAREYIGEVGWECVKRMGGWVGICSELSEDNKGVLFAQVRDLSMTLKKKSANGTIAKAQDWPDMLPDGSRNAQSIETRGDVAKLISDALNRK